jgi:hypothetical protein
MKKAGQETLDRAPEHIQGTKFPEFRTARLPMEQKRAVKDRIYHRKTRAKSKTETLQRSFRRNNFQRYQYQENFSYLCVFPMGFDGWNSD